MACPSGASVDECCLGGPAVLNGDGLKFGHWSVAVVVEIVVHVERAKNGVVAEVAEWYVGS